jgi:hypothetical protein
MAFGLNFGRTQCPRRRAQRGNSEILPLFLSSLMHVAGLIWSREVHRIQHRHARILGCPQLSGKPLRAIHGRWLTGGACVVGAFNTTDARIDTQSCSRIHPNPSTLETLTRAWTTDMAVQMVHLQWRILHLPLNVEPSTKNARTR